jgi:hypothetical protein
MGMTGYFDESERLEGDAPVAVAGVLFKDAAYRQFCRAWKVNVLQKKRFSCFHMTDLVTGRKEYEGVSISERVDILNAAVDAIDRSSYATISVLFNRTEFEQVAPLEWPLAFGSIYGAACHFSVQVTGYWLRKWRSPEFVAYVFERGHKFQAQSGAMLDAISRDQTARREFRYMRHHFEDKKMACGLQAADLVSWVVTKTALGGRTASLRPFVAALRRLAAGERERRIVYPLTGRRLVDFMVDQMKGHQEKTRMIYVDFGPRKRTLR